MPLVKRQVFSCPVGNRPRTPAGSFLPDFPVELPLPLTPVARLQARTRVEGLQGDPDVLQVMAEDC